MSQCHIVFSCVAIPATRLYIPSFIEIRSGVSEPQGVKIWPFPLLWLVAFTTACTTVQAVTSRHVQRICIAQLKADVGKHNYTYNLVIFQFLMNIFIC